MGRAEMTFSQILTVFSVQAVPSLRPYPSGGSTALREGSRGQGVGG